MIAKEIEQAGQDATSTPGKSSKTATDVSNPDLKYSPVSGMVWTREELRQEHRANLPVIPYEVFERVVVRNGVIIADEVA